MCRKTEVVLSCWIMLVWLVSFANHRTNFQKCRVVFHNAITVLGLIPFYQVRFNAEYFPTFPCL